MKKSVFAIFAGLCLVAGGAMAQVGGNVPTPINNAGFDASTGSFTNTADGGTPLDFAPGWRALHFGGSEVTFSVIADPTAPSAPNVMQITTDNSGGWAATQMDQDFPEGRIQGDFQPSNVYTFGAWFKNLKTERLDLLFRGAIFDATQNGYANEGNWVENITSNVWTKYTFAWSPAFAANEFSFQVIPGDWSSAAPPALLAFSFQCDSFEINDITAGERMINGGFEDSTAIPFFWNTTLTPGTTDRGMVGTIVTEAANVAEGSNALNIVKTNPGAAGDALFRTKDIPFTAGHVAYVAFSVKNDPTYGADSCVEFTLHSNIADSSIEQNPFAYLASGETDGGYKRYEFEVPITQENASKLYLDMRLRSNTNDDATQEAVFVDFISIGDLTAGGVPVEMSAFEIN